MKQTEWLEEANRRLAADPEFEPGMRFESVTSDLGKVGTATWAEPSGTGRHAALFVRIGNDMCRDHPLVDPD